jgi:hypothetical protein
MYAVEVAAAAAEQSEGYCCIQCAAVAQAQLTQMHINSMIKFCCHNTHALAAECYDKPGCYSAWLTRVVQEAVAHLID